MMNRYMENGLDKLRGISTWQRNSQIEGESGEGNWVTRLPSRLYRKNSRAIRIGRPWMWEVVLMLRCLSGTPLKGGKVLELRSIP